MHPVLDPLVSEAETEAQERAHTAWIRTELARRNREPHALFSHDPVMAEMRELDAAKVKALQEALEAGLRSGEPRAFDSEAFLRKMHAKYG